MDLRKKFLKDAKNSNCWIALPEAGRCERVLKAGLFAAKKKICNIILIGDEKLKQFECKNIKVINPKSFDKISEMSSLLFLLRKEKGLTLAQAKKLVQDENYFAVMLLKMGLCDGVVNGAITPSKQVIKPALQIIKSEKNVKTVSTAFIICNKNMNLILSDCALNINPDAQALSEIASISAKTCEDFLGERAKVGFLSYSTKGSASGESVDKICETLKILKAKKAKFSFDGEFQVDAALDENVAQLKATKSKIAGSCNTLIFPDLNSGNIGYKMLRLAKGCVAIGPVVQGLAKPVNDVSRSATQTEIVLSMAITAIQFKNQKGEN